MRNFLFLFAAILLANINLYASDTIRLNFQADYPIDSIKVENLDNKTSQTFSGQEELFFIDGKHSEIINPPTGLPNPIYKELTVFSLEDNSKVQISFDHPSSGMVTCEIFNLQGKQISSFSGDLPQGYQHFNFEADAPGVFIVRITTSSFS